MAAIKLFFMTVFIALIIIVIWALSYVVPFILTIIFITAVALVIAKEYQEYRKKKNENPKNHFR